ncbi:acyltransferase [Actinomycetospora sp. NBRC 106378]|nr:acyltransferase [Actinomycetospora sp. NBRC 106378]
MQTLGARYDPRRNGYDLIRLGLACLVVTWHSFPLAGTDVDASSSVVVGFLETTLDLFFAISGFLVLASWERLPRVGRHLEARFLRMFPGFWVCLVVTGFVVAPLGAWIAGTDPTAVFSGPHSAWAYVAANATTHMSFFDVAGTPTGVPLDGAWNGTLWSLQWETFCYLMVVTLGVLGLWRHRRAVLALAAVVLAAFLVARTWGSPGLWLETQTLRFVSHFLLGSVVYLYRDRLPVGRWWVAGAAALSVVGLAVPAVSPLTAPALVYLLHTTAASLRHPRLRLRWDVSFGVFLYGYPVQQLLVLLGVGVGRPFLLLAAALAVTLPLAWASCVLVERPVREWPARRRARRAETVLPVVLPAPATEIPR